MFMFRLSRCPIKQRGTKFNLSLGCTNSLGKPTVTSMVEYKFSGLLLRPPMQKVHKVEIVKTWLDDFWFKATYNQRKQTLSFEPYTEEPWFTMSLGGKESGPINRETWYIRVHFTLSYTKILFSGDRIEARYTGGPSKSGHGKSELYCTNFQLWHGESNIWNWSSWQGWIRKYHYSVSA